MLHIKSNVNPINKKEDVQKISNVHTPILNLMKKPIQDDYFM